MSAAIREMTIDDYDGAMVLWGDSEGVGLHTDDVDSREHVAAYLARHVGMSFVATDAGRIVGALLCGTDGRRGYLHHLTVAPSHRERGIARALVERCLAALAAAGIRKCHAFAFARNIEARNFWTTVGWRHREELVVMSKDIPATGGGG